MTVAGVIVDGQFWVGVGLLALLTLSPGASMALVSAVAAEHGRRAAFVTSLGLATGIVVYAAASALGMSVVLATSPEAFALMKTVGAFYLGYLGIRTLLRSRGRRAAVAAAPSGRAFYANGLLTNLLNPLIAVFYLTFLPQFIHAEEHVLAKALLFAAAHTCILVAWFAVYAYGITSLASRIGALQLWIQRGSGIVLVGFAVRLLAQSR